MLAVWRIFWLGPICDRGDASAWRAGGREGGRSSVQMIAYDP